MTPNFTLVEKVILIISLIVFILSGVYLSYRIYDTHASWVAASGGTYKEAQIGRPRIPNPLFCSQNPADQDLCSLIFAGLTRFDPEQQRVVPDVATEWNLSQDKKTYTFYLDPKATWHDGEPVTVDDVLFTYNTVLKDPAYQGPYAGIFDNVELEKIDDSTFIFRLTEPEAFFLRDTTIGLLPAHRLAAEPVERLANSAFNQRPIGAGPYKLTSLTLDEAKLTRHSDYHGASPYIENIILNFYPDIFALQQDRMILRNIKEIPVEAYREFIADPQFTIQGVELPQYVALFFNIESPLLRHRQVRRALRTFIEIPKVVELAQPARQLYDPIFIRAIEPQTGSGLTFNPEVGDRMLDDIGWIKNNEDRYVVERKNEDNEIEQYPIQLRLLTSDRGDFQAIAELIAGMFDWAGIDVQVDVRTGEQFLGALAARDYDLLLYGESVGRDLDFYPFWHSSQSTFPGMNLSQYANLEVDKTLKNIRETFDGTEQKDLLMKVREQLTEDAPAVWLYTPVYSFAHEPDLEGVNPSGYSTLSDRFWDLARNWYLKSKIKWSW